MFGKGSKKIDAVKELINKGHFDVVAQKLPPPAVDVKPIGNIVGVDSIINEVWRCINEDSDRGEMIGLYGEAGVGKSTLLKKLNNKFPDKNHYFDLMIWVTVSKEANYLEKIQEVLPKKSGIWDEIWKNKDADGRATEIWTSLRNKKFVLFLDDVWERIDLSKVGVSLNDNQKGSKVVFTTKLEGVFRQMTADDKRFKVECLSPEAALHLFHERVGENVLNSNPEIPKLAEIIAKKCNGLPLALVTIGHAMTSRRSAREWQRAIDELQCNTSRFPGTGNHVFPILRISYDSLSDDILKTCFLSCLSFPEGHNIRKDELIELWIGEGFLNNCDNIYNARLSMKSGNALKMIVAGYWFIRNGRCGQDHPPKET